MFVFLLSVNSYADEPDKLKHIAVSSVISTAGYAFLLNRGITRKNALIGSICFTLMVGVVKEYNDERWDNRDIGADLIGATLPILFVGF